MTGVILPGDRVTLPGEGIICPGKVTQCHGGMIILYGIKEVMPGEIGIQINGVEMVCHGVIACPGVIIENIIEAIISNPMVVLIMVIMVIPIREVIEEIHIMLVRGIFHHQSLQNSIIDSTRGLPFKSLPIHLDVLG